MQIRYKGTNNIGETLVYRENACPTLAEFFDLLKEDMAQHSTAICFELRIARPDPEVVRIKKRMENLIHSGYIKGNPTAQTVDRLFDMFNIKEIKT